MFSLRSVCKILVLRGRISRYLAVFVLCLDILVMLVWVYVHMTVSEMRPVMDRYISGIREGSVLIRCLKTN